MAAGFMSHLWLIPLAAAKKRSNRSTTFIFVPIFIAFTSLLIFHLYIAFTSLHIFIFTRLYEYDDNDAVDDTCWFATSCTVV